MDKEDKNKQAGSDDKKTAGRRKVLKSVVAGGGAATVAKVIPDQWARPVVDSVMLPSHAQTSGDPALGPFTALMQRTENEPTVQMAEEGFSEELMEFFAPAAQAGPMAIPLADFTMTANDSGDSYFCAVDSESPPQWIPLTIQNGAFTSGMCVLNGDLQVQDGNYVKGVGWVVTVARYPGYNVTTDITLTPSEDACGPGFGDQHGACKI